MFGQTAPTHENVTEFVEKRAIHRRRALKSGNVLFNSGYNSYGCTIRNFSEQGALVEMESTGGIPSEFDFRIKGDAKKYKGEIIWREASRMGVKFV